jgi:hypothetical protein
VDVEFKSKGGLSVVGVALHCVLANMGYRYIYGEAISPLTHPRSPQPNMPLLIHPFQFEFPPGSGTMSLKYVFKSPLPGADSSIVTSVSELHPLREETVHITLKEQFSSRGKDIQFSPEISSALDKYGFKVLSSQMPLTVVSKL